MIGDLKPYPEMKDSGLPWLEEVPEHWKLERAKWLFRKMDRPVRDTDEVVTCFRDGIVTLRKNRRVRGFTESLKEIGYQGIRRGDLVIHAMDASAGAVGVADSDGKGTPVYAVCEPALTANAQYYAYAVREMARSRWVQALAKGVRERSTDFRFDAFGSQPVPVPPLPEQAAIVHFLDHADRRIRRYSRAKQQLIKLLEERIMAKAAEAMAHPHCRTERLERISTHQLRSITRIDAQSYVALGLYNRGRGIFHKPAALGSELGDSTFLWVKPGDLVISGQFAWEGAVALASAAEEETIVSHRYHVLRGIEGRSTTPFLWTLLRSEFGAMLLDQHSRGAAGRNRPLNLRTLLKERVPLPPYAEQLTLNDLAGSIAPIRAEIEAEISVLREYRTRLIADVVTGKLDVREAAARLPEEFGEAESSDDADDLSAVDDTAGFELDEVLVEAEA